MTSPLDSPWLERVSRLRVWTRNGIRAPHKPLLLLYALGRLQRQGHNVPIPFAEAEAPMQALLDEYGPPNPTHPGYPFHHLTSDGLWTVVTRAGVGSPGASAAILREAEAVGALDSRFAQALLGEPGLLTQVARLLLDANFPPSLHDEIAATAGLTLYPVIEGAPRVIGQMRRRDPAFRAEVLLAYEARCAVCGWDGHLAGAPAGVEAAHLRWFNVGGPDTVDNGLCLCSLHHLLLDRGALGITGARTLAVSLRFVAQGEMAKRMVYGLVGKPLERPQGGHPLPSVEHITWHTRQVFRGPARSVD